MHANPQADMTGADSTPGTDREQSRGRSCLPLLAVPVLLALASLLLWPQVKWLAYAANAAVLLTGSVLACTIWEHLAGSLESFSLPFVAIGLVVIAGLVLFHFLGWISTLCVLGAYALVNLLGGLHDRKHLK